MIALPETSLAGKSTDPFPDGSERAAGLFAAIATPKLYQLSPFRQTGLSVLAGPRVAAKRVDSLRQTLELRTAKYGWAFAPGIAPTTEQLLVVGQALKDPVQRFGYEFFWFWPESYPEDAPDATIEHLARRDVESALVLWRRAESAGSVVAAHNLAVYHHLQALGGESIWSPTDELRLAAWTETSARWRALDQCPGFWKKVEARLEQLDEPQLSGARGGHVRAALPAALAMINAGLVSRHAQRKDRLRAEWHSAFLRETYAWAANGTRMLEDCARPLARQVELLLSDAERAMANAPDKSLTEIVRLLDPEPLELKLVEQLCGAESGYARELRSSFGSAMLDHIVRHQRQTADNVGCLPWLDRLRGWTVAPELAERIREVHTLVAAAVEAATLPADASELVVEAGDRTLNISPAGIRFGDVFLRDSDVMGIRHGQMPGATEADEPTPVVAWWSAQGEIVLDAQNFFGADGAGATRYRKVLAACDRWVVHGLLGRLARVIDEESPIFVGEESFTAAGVVFSSPDAAPGNPSPVPYRAVQGTLENGHFHLVDRRTGRRSASYPVHTCWNAVIAGDLLEIMAYFQPRPTA